MDHRAEVREFLVSRRGRITPEQAGLEPTEGRRRVTGLRRQEVARLAGVSIDYYTRLERGNLSGVSESVLDAIARTLELDSAEHDYLYDLARTANSPGRNRHTTPSTPQPVMQYLLDAITGAPAFIGNWQNGCGLWPQADGQRLQAGLLAQASIEFLGSIPSRPRTG